MLGSDLAPVLVVEHEKAGGLGRLAAHLGDLDVRRPYAGDELPVSLGGFSGLVVLGGDVAAWDDEKAPWLPGTRRLLASGVRSGVPVWGICLGAQLLTLACGGRVGRGSAGLEVGLTEVSVAAAGDRLLGSVPGRFSVPQYHRDAILEPPSGAVVLATGERYRVQAFRVGPLAWGVQYHPEVTAADFGSWVHGGREELTAEGYDADALRDAVEAEDERLDGLAEAHASAFAAVVRSVAGARAPSLGG